VAPGEIVLISIRASLIEIPEGMTIMGITALELNVFETMTRLISFPASFATALTLALVV
jgi:hypothetical protein